MHLKITQCYLSTLWVNTKAEGYGSAGICDKTANVEPEKEMDDSGGILETKSPRESQQPTDQEGCSKGTVHFQFFTASLAGKSRRLSLFWTSLQVLKCFALFVLFSSLSPCPQQCYKKILELQPQCNLKGVPAKFFPNSFKARSKKWEESSSPTSTGIYMLT